MGRKKKFIDKKESSTFHVVHRSQQDRANEGEEEASEFVLIPSGPLRDSRSQEQGNGKGEGKRRGGLAAGKRDHINALGLPNDGYDYEQHLKSMGGGTFVPRSGRVQHFAEGSSQGARGGGAKAAIAIPEEALPSRETLDRQLEAVTISEKVMDGDMRRALAAGLAGVDEEEDWSAEENMLDDDFVMQAAGVGDDEGFDFDAHMARLMEASAKETGLRQRTADDDLQMKGLLRLRRDSDSESDDDSDGGGGGGGGSDDSGEIDDALLEGLDINGGEEGEGGGVLGEGSEERAVLDSQFEATLAAYDSDDWGELEEDDDRVQGQWDLEQHDYANTCMDDFLATKEDARWTEGVQRLPPEQRAVAVATLAVEAAAAKPGSADGGSSGGAAAAAAAGGGEGGVTATGEGGGAGGAVSAATGGPRLGALSGLGSVAVEELEEEEEEEEDELHDMEHHNEYLRDKPAERWDCETIVSTYSNLDNHPSVLGTGRKPKPRRPRRSSPAADVADGVSLGGAGDAGAPVKQVTLSQKTGLPLGVLPERTFNDTGMVSLVAGKNAGEKRDTEETAEEKRLRKAQIKQSKREKRAQKKSVKVAFTTEAKITAKERLEGGSVNPVDLVLDDDDDDDNGTTNHPVLATPKMPARQLLKNRAPEQGPSSNDGNEGSVRNGGGGKRNGTGSPEEQGSRKKIDTGKGKGKSKGKGSSASARNGDDAKHRARPGGRGITTTRSRISILRVKQEGPSSEASSGLVFRAEFAWQKTFESMVVVAAKMWSVRPERIVARKFISTNVKKTHDETDKLVQKLKGTAERDFGGVYVDVAKLVKICHEDEDVSNFLLGDKDRINHKRRITRQFESYVSLSDMASSKSQTEGFYDVDENGRPRCHFLKAVM
eukprot:g6534.t1